MKDITQMKNTLLARDPTYTQEELDGMTPAQVRKAYQDYVDTLRYDPEDWAWRHAHILENTL